MFVKQTGMNTTHTHTPVQRASALAILNVLVKRYPQKGMMDLGNPEDTLIATILSARTRDTQVLKIYPAFRKRFPTLRDLARASVSSIATSINTIGMFRNKAKSIHALAERLISSFNGKVPGTMDELLTLPGVGRKTASCVLSSSFSVPAVAVDTHVFRIAHRLGWTTENDPDHVEEEIKTLIPKKRWSDVNRVIVQFGRDICQPRTPHCYACPVAKHCPFLPKTEKP